VFVSENGLALPDFSTEMSLAAVANNARVVVDTIQTGGVSAAGLVSAATRGVPPVLFGPAFAVKSLQALSSDTGGVSSVYSYADKGEKRIDDATRFPDLRGYYARGEQDGKYRRISVKVTRPGAQVLYRHGYFARAQTLPPNRRDMMSYTRMATALTTGVNVYDIPVGFSTREERDGEQHVLAMDISIGLAKLAPVMNAGVRQYGLELAIVCANADQKLVGQYSQRLSFSLSEDQYQKALKEGVPAKMTVRVPVTSYASHVKVVVYNFENDLVGSIMKKVR